MNEFYLLYIERKKNRNREIEGARLRLVAVDLAVKVTNRCLLK